MDDRSFATLGLAETATASEVRRTYRALAKRWHPDRFLAGPEREWAGVKMAEINAAYHVCMQRAKNNEITEGERLNQARRLIDNGQLSNAREVLMRIETRCAEWNYLFGTMLLRRYEYEKAVVYLSVAAHQRPGNLKYARAEKLARGMNVEQKKQSFFSRLRNAALRG